MQIWCLHQYISSHVVNRVDVICDVYKPDSLKSTAREKKSEVIPTTVIPQN